MAGWFEVNQHKNGQYGFVLKASNGEPILVSEQYMKKATALDGIASVRVNSPIDNRYERLTAKDGSPYFNLKAANGQVIGTSEMYSSTANRDKGIESVKTNGQSVKTIDNA